MYAKGKATTQVSVPVKEVEQHRRGSIKKVLEKEGREIKEEVKEDTKEDGTKEEEKEAIKEEAKEVGEKVECTI